MDMDERIEQIEKELIAWKTDKHYLAITDKIKKLEKEKKQLKKKKLDDGPFEKRFLDWLGKGQAYPWIPREKDMPILYKWMDDNWDLHRYETIILEEWLEEEFGYFWDPDVLKEDLEDGTLTSEKWETIQALAKEIMDANMKSFKCDW